MTTGSLCLTEILMSRKSCSSNSEHSHSADSTSASGVALPYLASSRLSSEPAFTPIRIGIPASLAARAISPTLSSNFLMLPGFTRTAAHPASMAAKTYRGWKWMLARGPRRAQPAPGRDRRTRPSDRRARRARHRSGVATGAQVLRAPGHERDVEVAPPAQGDDVAGELSGQLRRGGR